MKKMHVCIVTGTRAEFGIWRPVIAAIEQSSKLELSVVVTGMHLQNEFGNTVKDVERAGVKIAAKVPMYEPGEVPAKSLARGIEGLAAGYRKIKPDLVFVLGDRLEMLAAASAALAERIPIAHLHGGETAPGVWDEQIRHAITKMAQLHFCATATARARILRMGETPEHVHQVGAPALDSVEEEWRLIGPIVSKVRSYIRRGKRAPEAMLLLHPTGGTDEQEYENAAKVLAALREADVYFYTIGPNNDPGHAGILASYRDASVKLEMSLTQDQYWHKLAYCSFLIGNSSSGIIEAASFGVPVINLGPRQSGRERNENVIDVPWSAGTPGILRAIQRALGDRSFRQRIARRKNLYGDGKASSRIVGVLEQVADTPITLTKQFHS